MLILAYLLAAAVAGFAAGWLLQGVSVLRWMPDLPLTGMVCGCVGQACRAALAWTSRPSEPVHPYQRRLSSAAAIAVIALALTASTTFLRFPATIVVPAASYLLIRVLLSWQERAAYGCLSPVAMQIAARGGEILTLAASAVAAREPLS